MKLNYDNLIQKTSRFKSATGLSKEEFDYLVPVFEMEWDRLIENYTFEGKPRVRKRKVRKNNTFKSVPDMLIFILYDYRHNPTQDFMGLHFSLTQPKIALWIKVLEPILERSLKKLKLLPTRENIRMNDGLVDSITILLDGSERPINRPKYDQKEYYSGKKSNIQ
jgi:hypothetical protein